MNADTDDLLTFEMLYTQYADYLLMTAKKFLRSREDAEDATQETWLRVYQNIDTYRGERVAISIWLFTILRHICYHIRKRNVVKDATPYYTDDGLHMADPWRIVAAQKSADAVEAALAVLPQRQRYALEHHYAYDVPYAVIGQQMGCSEGAARVHAHCGLTKMRAYFN